MSRILVAEDEPRMRRLVCDFLKNSGHETIEAADGRQAIDAFAANKGIDLVVCDIMMPEVDGWEVCKTIRETSSVPIIVLTARSQEFDELVSFESGADDFITKPFSMPVFIKRVEALLKRSGAVREETSSDIISIDGLRINIPAHEVSLDGAVLDLKIKKFSLLEKLASNPGRTFSREALLDEIWGVDFYGDSRTVDSHLARLRTKLGAWGDKHIKTVFGVGYKIEVNGE